MMSRSRSLAFTFAVCAVFFSGCGSGGNQPTLSAPAPVLPAAPVASTPSVGGATVFTMNNSQEANAVLAFTPKSDGSLTQSGTYLTGGRGSGSGLQNQAALAFSTDRRFLFVVNAGSNDFSVFELSGTGLSLASRTASGGARPISITEHGGVVYVLNLDSTSGAEGFDSISGFQIDAKGQASPISNSVRPLSAKSTSAAQVAFSPDGTLLLVTERATAIIDAFPIDANGVPSAQAVVNQSTGSIPFGFQFLDGTHVLVSEEGTNGVSSYAVSKGGILSSISRSIPTFQAAVCWLAITPDARFAFTGNTSGSSLSGFSINPDVSVSLLKSDGLSASTDGGALDVAISSNSKYLYTVLTSGTLETFAIDATGGLKKVQSVPSLGSINGVIAL